MSKTNEGRFKVVKEPFGYSVIDSQLLTADRRVEQYGGKTARAKAWAEASRRNREDVNHVATNH